MDNKGKLLEAWVATCAGCGEEIVLHWDNGIHMSKSQAKHILTDEKSWNWTETDDGWLCSDCRSD